MKRSSYDALLVQQTGESILIRLESFGDEFKRLAKTANQSVLAERFNVAVGEIAKNGPVTAAELEPLGEWLQGQEKDLTSLARTAEQKKLAASFREFVKEVNSPAVSEAFQRPLVNALIEEMKDALAEGSSNGIPLAWLSQADKQLYLAQAIDWTDYIDRGLDTGGSVDDIINRAVAGRPSEQWLGRTEPAEEIEARYNGQQQLKKLTMTDLKAASQKSPEEKTRSPEADKGKDTAIER